MPAQRLPPHRFTVRELPGRDLPRDVVAAWSALEGRALETSAYLSPHFVVPALRHLDPNEEAVVFLVEADEGTGGPDARQLVGVAVCRVVRGTRHFPVPHLVAYRSKHSYMTGILLDRDCAADALAALFGELHKQRWRWHGLEFEVMWGNGPLHDLIRGTSARMGLGRQEWHARSRAIVDLAADRSRLEQNEAEQRHGLRRRYRRLEELGRVEWSLVRHGGVPTTTLQAFLDLEHQGWKGDNQSSLLARRENEAFFREMVAGFSNAERAIFLELKINGETVGASCQFVSGTCASAFKIGWRPDLAKMSPGVMAELELMRRMRADPACADVSRWCSGAEEGSYIEKLWPGRRPVVSMGVTFSPVGRSLLGVMQTVRDLRRRYRERSARDAPPSSN
jgi:hypothetical protein